MKTKNKPVKKPAIKLYGIPARTGASKAIKKLKWHLKDKRPKGHCIKQGCSKTGCQKIFCKKHQKILRKLQLKLNNIPWRKKKSQPGYKPKQMHLVYAGRATKETLKDEKRARIRVKRGMSIITSTKMLQKAIEAAKAERKANRKPIKEKATKAKVKPSKKVKVKKAHKKEAPAKRGKIATAIDEETIDLT